MLASVSQTLYLQDRMHAEHLVTQVKHLLNAIHFADPPKEFSGVLCHEARIPIEFVTAVEDAINLYQPPFLTNEPNK